MAESVPNSGTPSRQFAVGSRVLDPAGSPYGGLMDVLGAGVGRSAASGVSQPIAEEIQKLLPTD